MPCGAKSDARSRLDLCVGSTACTVLHLHACNTESFSSDSFQVCFEPAHVTMPCHIAMLLLFQSTFYVNITKNVSAKCAILAMQRETCNTCLPCELICGRLVWPACARIQHLFYSQTHVASVCLPTPMPRDYLSLRLDTSSFNLQAISPS